MGATKRARVDRGMVPEMRVTCDEEGNGDGYKSDGDEEKPRQTVYGIYAEVLA